MLDSIFLSDSGIFVESGLSDQIFPGKSIMPVAGYNVGSSNPCVMYMHLAYCSSDLSQLESNEEHIKFDSICTRQT